jgi:hypothetical protein
MRTGDMFLKGEFLQQRGEHPLYYEECGFGSRMLTRIDHVQVSGEEKKIFKLAGGAHGPMQELLKFAPATAAAAFRDIGGDGPRCTAPLTAASVALVLGRSPGHLVDAENQWMTPSPNVKAAEILHTRLTRTAGSCCTYLQLDTNHGQLARRGHYVQ